MRPSSTVTNRAYWNNFINATTRLGCSIDSVCNNNKKHECAIDYLCSSQYSVHWFDIRERGICLLRNIRGSIKLINFTAVVYIYIHV